MQIEYSLIQCHIWVISRFQEKTSSWWMLQIIKKKTRSSLCKDFYIQRACNSKRSEDKNEDSHEYWCQDEHD